MKFKIAILFLLLITTYTFSQITGDDEIIPIHKVKEKTESDIPFAIIEEVPVYPGCTGNNNIYLKKCLSIEISNFISRNFNLDDIIHDKCISRSSNGVCKKWKKGLEISGENKIMVNFRISKEGNVDNIQAQSRYPELKNEAIRVVKLLPKMKPGKQQGKNVGVLYSLPIAFSVE